MLYNTVTRNVPRVWSYIVKVLCNIQCYFTLLAHPIHQNLKPEDPNIIQFCCYLTNHVFQLFDYYLNMILLFETQLSNCILSGVISIWNSIFLLLSFDHYNYLTVMAVIRKFIIWYLLVDFFIDLLGNHLKRHDLLLIIWLLFYYSFNYLKIHRLIRA